MRKNPRKMDSAYSAIAFWAGRRALFCPVEFSGGSCPVVATYDKMANYQ
jgi:hypothetical protein